MNSLALGVSIAVALWSTAARASCADPTACICDAKGATILEARRSPDAGALPDGGAESDVVGVFGVVPDGGGPTALVLPDTEPASVLLGGNGFGHLVPLSSDEKTACVWGPSLSRDDAVHAMLAGDGCGKDVDPSYDGTCNDTSSCESVPDGISLMLLLMVVTLLRARQRA